MPDGMDCPAPTTRELLPCEQTFRQRLLDVAWATENTLYPEFFTMRRYTHECGTPGCALGNYLSCQELHPFQWNAVTEKLCTPQGLRISLPHLMETHFGLSHKESERLFGSRGCDNAQTPQEAAAYIRQFVANKYG